MGVVIDVVDVMYSTVSAVVCCGEAVFPGTATSRLCLLTRCDVILFVLLYTVRSVLCGSDF